MAELVPIPFATLLKRIYYEYTRNGAIFDLPIRKFYIPDGSVDLSVVSCGSPAANPLGPAAGPHTQLAQNIVLSWLAGARIIELKTVQVNDRLALARPCIDVGTIGYNTEWSQELRLEESAREYVKASMIVEILKHWLFYSGAISAERAAGTVDAADASTGTGAGVSDAHARAAGETKMATGAGLSEVLVPVHAMNLDTIFDVSVGYDLAGIQSAPIREWLCTMRDASTVIEELRAEIPAEFEQYRKLPFTKKISDSITLSTFHGTPAHEIERICEFLLDDMGFHVVVKMNPPMLGKARLEQLLHDTLGYTDIEVNPAAYDVNIAFDDAAAMMKRLQGVAARAGKIVGVKFGNTLEVINKGTFLKDKVQYLSGQPLHVLHLALVNRWRTVFGSEFPVSFSAGVDAMNFPDCVAIGLVPTTTCTDLLRPGGYGRLQQYLLNLEKRMKSAGASTIDEFIVLSDSADPGQLQRAMTGKTAASVQSAASTDAISAASSGIAAQNTAGLTNSHGQTDGRGSEPYALAIMKNSERLLNRSIEDPRYRSSHTSKAPRKIGSHLALWDCINCDKCIPVCPNDANFFFDVEPVSIAYNTCTVTRTGWTVAEGGVLTIAKQHQIGTYADACNECGNCDVFCPEDGGPYIEKPRFFGSLESYRRQRTIDGYVLQSGTQGVSLFGRFVGIEYELTTDAAKNEAVFTTANARVTVDRTSHAILNAELTNDGTPNSVDMRHYAVMAALLKGIGTAARINFVTIDVTHV